MQGVLAISHLSGSPDRVCLWNDLLSDPRHRRTVVRETEIISGRDYLRWSISGGNNHPDCRQKLD